MKKVGRQHYVRNISATATTTKRKEETGQGSVGSVAGNRCEVREARGTTVFSSFPSPTTSEREGGKGIAAVSKVPRKRIALSVVERVTRVLPQSRRRPIINVVPGSVWPSARQRSFPVDRRRRPDTFLYTLRWRVSRPPRTVL